VPRLDATRLIDVEELLMWRQKDLITTRRDIVTFPLLLTVTLKLLTIGKSLGFAAVKATEL